MFKVGDFSKLTRVPVKTLHYYDDIGLFKPLRVDRFTGYRYYSFDQLPRLNRILALRDLGFPLEQIARILDDDLTPEQLTGMLRLRQAELQQQFEATQARLTQVAHRIEQIRQEGKMPSHEIILKQVAPVKIASAREVVAAPEQMRERCNALLAEVCDMLAKNQLPTNGVCLALYHDHSAQGIDVEMALFVPENSADVQQGRAAVRTLPLETMASAVYRGSYDDHAAVGQLHVEVGKWIEANGYRITGASREIYLKTPDNFDSAGIMEIQFPIEKA
jgi:DNA-binding transcriptional MerR regulator